MSSLDIENQIVDAEKQLKAYLQAHATVEQEKLMIQRSILELQLKKKDIEISLDKSRHSIKQLELDIKLLTKKFWSEKNSGG